MASKSSKYRRNWRIDASKGSTEAAVRDCITALSITVRTELLNNLRQRFVTGPCDWDAIMKKAQEQAAAQPTKQ